ncbi:MAG: hypothetical protein AAFY65_11635 [Pseudomonadota bacterium]
MRDPIRSERRAAILARAQARHEAETSIVEGEVGDWLSDVAFSFLANALIHYSDNGTFLDALEHAPDFAVRKAGPDKVAFRHFDSRMSGTLNAKKAKVKFVGITATRLMQDIVAAYCTGPDGQPQRMQIAAGARMVHLAQMRMSGERMMRHACYDGFILEPTTGVKIRAATLMLKPLPPPVLILDQPLRIN